MTAGVASKMCIRDRVEHSRHRCFDNFIVNLLGAIAAYCLIPKQTCINVQRTIDTQIALFWIRRTHVIYLENHPSSSVYKIGNTLVATMINADFYWQRDVYKRQLQRRAVTATLMRMLTPTWASFTLRIADFGLLLRWNGLRFNIYLWYNLTEPKVWFSQEKRPIVQILLGDAFLLISL